MSALLIGFLLSFMVCIIILRSQHLHARYSADHDLRGIQKFHVRAVPRIGGIAIMVGLIGGIATRSWVDLTVLKFATWMLISAIPVFVAGLLEDITKKVGPGLRFIAALSSAAIAGFLFDAWLVNVQFIGLDTLLAIPAIAIAFTCFAVAGVTNAFNIIDGYNGLLAIVALVILVSIAYVGFQVHDFVIMVCAFSAIGALAGFFIWNYPRGHLFLGDGGAYLLGFWVAELSILLVTRNPQISKWYPVLLCFYPIFETLFTIYRRLVLQKRHVGMPDAAHLHQIIYKRLVRFAVGSQDAKHRLQRNYLTAPYLWVLSSLAVIPATLFWNSKWLLEAFIVLFALTYVWLYWRIIRFKAPRWLMIRKITSKN